MQAIKCSIKYQKVSIIFLLACCFSFSSIAQNAITCATLYADNPTAPDGLYTVDPDGNGPVTPFTCYCNMSEGGYASIFQLSGTLAFDMDPTCVFDVGIDDHDGTILWTDLTTKLNTNDDNDTDNDYMTWNRDGTTSAGAPLSNRPPGIDDESPVVPLPCMNTEAWFDRDNEFLHWNGNTISFSDLGFDEDLLDISTGNHGIIITDGINNIYISHEDEDFGQLLSFDFENNTVTLSDVPDFADPSDYHRTEEDPFGHVLWTVNGKPTFYSDGDFYFRGTIADPNGTPILHPMVGNDDQHGMDFFARVDTEDRLWFGDWGHDDNGFFECPGGNDNMFSAARTNIVLVKNLNVAPIPTLTQWGIIILGLLFLNFGLLFIYKKRKLTKAM